MSGAKMTDLDRLAEIAAQLAGRVRDDDPDANARWLANVLPDPADWFRLAFVLASAIPGDRTWAQLTEWHTGVGNDMEVRRRQWRDAQRKRRAA